MARLEDKILEALREAGGAMPGADIVARFLGALPGAAGERALEAILSRDRRFARTEEGWTVSAAARNKAASPLLAEVPWLAVGAEEWNAGPEKALLVAVARFPAGAVTSSSRAPLPAVELHLAASPRLPAGAAETLGEQWGFPCRLQTRGRLLRLFDDLFAERALFLRLFASRPLGGLWDELEATGTALPEHLCPLPDLFRAALGREGGIRLEEVLAAYTIEACGETPLQTELRALPDLVSALMEDFFLAGVNSLDEAAARRELPFRPFSLEGKDFDEADLEALPDAPGVYLLHDAGDAVAYVGKSVSVRRRVGGYFRRQAAEGDEKLQRIQALTRRIGVIPAGSDLEASLEEARLIRELKPPVNTQLEVRPGLEAEKPLEEPVVALLPDVSPAAVAVYLLHPSGLVFRRSVDRSAPDVLALEAFLRAAGEGGAPAAAGGDREGFPLALRWLRRNAHRIVFFRYHDYADAVRSVQAILARMPDVPSVGPA